jgi:GAF domain-containing protein
VSTDFSDRRLQAGEVSAAVGRVRDGLDGPVPDERLRGIAGQPGLGSQPDRTVPEASWGLVALYELGAALATINTAEQVAARTIEAISAELNCSDAWAVEVHAGDRFVALDALGGGTGVLEVMLVRTARPSWELLRATEAGQLLWLADRERLRSRLPGLAEAFADIRAGVLLPLRAPGEPAAIGAVGLIFDRARPPAPGELRFLAAVGELAGQGLHRARLRAGEHAARRAADAAAERAERMGALAAALVAAQTPGEVTATLAAQVQQAVDAQTFSLRTVDAGNNCSRAVSMAGEPMGYRERFCEVSLQVPSALDEVARTRRPVFLTSARDNRRRYGAGGVAEHYESARIEALARLPLLVDGELIAVLSVGYWSPREFDDAQRPFLTTIADLAAQALGRAMRTEQLRADERRHRLLAAAQAAINRRLDPVAQLRALARVVVPELADLSTVHVLATPVAPGVMPALPVRTDRVAVEVIAGVAVPPASRGLEWGEGSPIVQAIREGRLTEPIATPAVPGWSPSTDTAATFRAGLNRVVLAPVLAEGLVVAVVAFGMCHDRPEWTGDDLAILRQIAGYAAVAVEHGLTYQHTRDTALVLQRSLLCAPPVVAGLQLCARYQPAGRDEVGGDWYDAFQTSPGSLSLSVGDVVGHDITAAAAMGQLRAALRTLALREDLEPAAVLDALAEANASLRITALATAVHARLRRVGRDWDLAFSLAGHPPPVLIDPAGRARALVAPPGIALVPGLLRSHRSARLRLAPGSTLLLYTDGLIERRGADLGQAIARLCTRAAELSTGPLEQLCEQLLAGADGGDDVVLLAARTEP